MQINPHTTLHTIPTTSSKAVTTAQPTQTLHLHTMKLLSTTALFLTSLFTTTTLANPNFSIKFEPLPSTVAAGTTYNVKWTTNQDFVSPPNTHNNTPKRRDIDSTNEPEKLTIKSLHSNTGNRRLPPRAPPLQHRQRLGTRAQSHKQLRQHDRRRPEHKLESTGFEG
jgi:hypothetical protein